jgi:hypothetical protein
MLMHNNCCKNKSKVWHLLYFFSPTLIALKLAQSREMVAAMVYLMQVGFKPIQALLKFQLNHKLF